MSEDITARVVLTQNSIDHATDNQQAEPISSFVVTPLVLSDLVKENKELKNFIKLLIPSIHHAVARVTGGQRVGLPEMSLFDTRWGKLDLLPAWNNIKKYLGE